MKGAPMDNGAPLLFWGYVSQEAAALIASVIAALLIGWITLRDQRQIASARLAFETFTKKNWDKDYLEKRTQFVRLCTQQREGLVKYIEKQSDPADADMATIRAVLNDYEIMAIGIRQGILDEEFAFRFMRGMVVTDWLRSSA